MLMHMQMLELLRGLDGVEFVAAAQRCDEF